MGCEAFNRPRAREDEVHGPVDPYSSRGPRESGIAVVRTFYSIRKGFLFIADVHMIAYIRSVTNSIQVTQAPFRSSLTCSRASAAAKRYHLVPGLCPFQVQLLCQKSAQPS